MQDQAIGIDLGTTHSLAAIFRNDGAELVDPNQPLVPSVVYFPANGTPIAGREAVLHAQDHPERTLFSIKRLMGKGPQDLSLTEQNYPFHLIAHQGLWTAQLDTDHFVSPPEVSAHILREILNQCEAKLGYRPSRAVITVPAYFNDKQRSATKQAAEMLGLRVIRMINEPTAAALAYGMGHLQKGTVAVYDLGGGTFDLTLLSITDGVFRVLATHGDTLLGGDDFDDVLMHQCLAEWQIETHQVSAQEKHHLRQNIKRARESLSQTDQVELVVSLGGLPKKHLITRKAFDDLIDPLIQKTLKATRKALRDAQLTAGDIEHVVLVGGTTRTPLVIQRVGSFFGLKPRVDLNPDHVVALGAAIQAALLDQQTQDMLLMDVTPLSLGIETMGGAVNKVIMRNAPIPARATEQFTTYMDNQTGMDFHIVQGERELAEDNISLARFKLSGIPPMPAGLALVNVRFQLDADGILTVEAEEQRSGQRAAIEVVPGHGLDMDSVRQRVLDSIEHAQEDIESIRIITARTKAQTLVLATKRALAQSQSLSPEERETISSAVRAAEDVIESKDVAAIESASEKLNQATQSLAEQLLERAFTESVRGKTVSEL
ncbi:MAG: Fe-S protein assembly chaperone HscA [Acidobacteria bacterium]|nr:Fe-S protein assembly chaperone HscA [Acidobacteriota bacterium]